MKPPKGRLINKTNAPAFPEAFSRIGYAKFFRPFFRRARSTARPELVLIRALNPDVRAFFNLVPCKVLFVIVS